MLTEPLSLTVEQGDKLFRAIDKAFGIDRTNPKMSQRALVEFRRRVIHLLKPEQIEALIA